MDNIVNLDFNQLDNSMNLLNKLVEDSDKYVSILYEKMKHFVSQKENETEKKQKDLIKQYKEKHDFFNGKIQILKNKWSRENFQILLYGKVSTGKSKIINAILREDIFQSGSSHTTSCFVKICKSSDQYHHIEYRNEKNQYDQLDDVKMKIKTLSTTLYQNTLKSYESLSVFLNIPNNKILTSNTEIIDCPGSANQESITNDLKEQGLKADVFIYVLTGGITEDEKSFFQYQWEKSSKPMIFFLINKWEQASNDGDDVAANSKRQIIEGIQDFLKYQIKLSENESENRIYFISALYICKKRKVGKANSRNIVDDDNEYCLEFEKFEETLSEFKQSFIKTKYVEELQDIRSKINESIKIFKIEFQKTINIEYIEGVKRFLKDIQECSERKKINIEINELTTELKNFEKECENINRYTIEGLNKKLNNLMKTNTEQIPKLHIKIGQILDEQIKNYKETCKIDVIKEKHEMKEKIEKEIKLQTVTDNAWQKFCNIFTKIFGVLRNHFLKNLNENDNSILTKNLEKIKAVTHELIDENLNALLNYLKTETEKITKQLEIKIEVYEEFSREIGNLFNV